MVYSGGPSNLDCHIFVIYLNFQQSFKTNTYEAIFRCRGSRHDHIECLCPTS